MEYVFKKPSLVGALVCRLLTPIENVLDTAIRAHSEHGLIMDFAMGPNQGQGVPAHENDTGLMWDLVPHHVFVPADGSFHGTVPGWGTGVLQAVVTGLINNSTSVLGSAAFFADGQAQAEGTRHTLAERSLEDATPRVSEDGWLDVDFASSGPVDSGQQQHLVYAVYLVRSGARAQQPPAVVTGPQTTPTDYVHNGSWTVDHFSARGARVMTDFWEKHLLTNGTRERLQQVARCAWEDSIEINPNLYWTPELPTAFARRRGYSISKYYPLLFHENSLRNHFADQFVTDEADAGHSHVADYRTTVGSFSLLLCVRRILFVLTQQAYRGIWRIPRCAADLVQSIPERGLVVTDWLQHGRRHGTICRPHPCLERKGN